LSFWFQKKIFHTRVHLASFTWQLSRFSLGESTENTPTGRKRAGEKADTIPSPPGSRMRYQEEEFIDIIAIQSAGWVEFIVPAVSREKTRKIPS
jgi:hypothetical protein